MRRSQMKKGLRELHGADVEIVEVVYDRSAPARRYRVVAPPEPEFLAGWPQWLRVMFAVTGLAVMIPYALLLLVALAGCCLLLYFVVSSFFTG